MAVDAPASSCSVKTATTSSTAYAITSGAAYQFLLVYNTGAVPVHYAIGGASASATSGDGGDPAIMAGGQIDIWTGGATHIALVTGSSTAGVYFHPYSEKAR